MGLAGFYWGDDLLIALGMVQLAMQKAHRIAVRCAFCFRKNSAVRTQTVLLPADNFPVGFEWIGIAFLSRQAIELSRLAAEMLSGGFRVF